MIGLAHLRAETPLDGSFNPTLNGAVSSLALQADGKVIIGGGFTTVNGVAKSYLARLNPDGSLDNSFAPNNAPGQFVSRVLVVNSNIYVGAGDGLRRFDVNGTVAWHYPMSVTAFAADSQQRIIIGGQFNRVDGQYHRNIARLSAGGTLDSTFATAIGCCAGESVDALATQGDAILVGGLFQSVNATNVVSHFTRLTADGSLDGTFNATATPRVLAILPMADGKIFRVSEQMVARHLASGADDTSFASVSSGGSSGDRFVTIAVGADGKPIVGGNFTTDGGATRRYVARFNADGSADASLTVSPNAQVNTIAVQADGRVVIGGWFTEVNGSARVGIARLQSPSATPALIISAGADGKAVISWPEGGSYALETTKLGANTWTTVAAAPVVVDGKHCVTNACAGMGRLFRLRAM